MQSFSCLCRSVCLDAMPAGLPCRDALVRNSGWLDGWMAGGCRVAGLPARQRVSAFDRSANADALRAMRACVCLSVGFFYRL
mmetsp:Transcript_15929/g.45367  ORF Transcript_15929/g.45367 Transcript_15929/m.45367 type:complete len:82 (-) Transcript_15929:133-378(-)